MGKNASRRGFVKAAGMISAAISLGIAGCLGGDDGEFPSQEITFLEGYGEGSGFDAYARAIAEEWQDELDTDIIVDNETGAGGRNMVNRLYNSDGDGYTVGILNIPGFVVSQAALDVSYDLLECTMLGRSTRGTYTIYTSPDNDIDSWEDLAALDEVQWGEEGMGSSSSFVAIVFSEAADLNTEFITGYDASTDLRRAVVQEEIDVALSTVSSAGPMIRDEELEPLIVFSERDAIPDWMPDVPHTTEEVDQFEGFAESLNISRIIGAPPDVPDERAELLEETLWDVINSDELEQWADEANRSLQGRTRGSEAMDITEESLDTFEKHMDHIEEYVE